MIARIFSVLTLACILSSIGVYGEEQTKGPRSQKDPAVIPMPKQDAWLTKDQAQHILTSIEMLVHQIQDLNKQNKAPRTDAPGTCDPSYPGCGLVDLSGVLAGLCSIQNQIFCLCERTASIADIPRLLYRCVSIAGFTG